MVLSLTTIFNFYGGLPDSIRTQSGSVLEYYDNFLAYAESVQVTNPELLISYFINGLKTQIHREVFHKNPKSMLQAWCSARLCEIHIEAEEQPNPEIQAQIQTKMQQQSQSPDSDSATTSRHPRQPDQGIAKYLETDYDKSEILASESSRNFSQNSKSKFSRTLPEQTIIFTLNPLLTAPDLLPAKHSQFCITSNTTTNQDTDILDLQLEEDNDIYGGEIRQSDSGTRGIANSGAKDGAIAKGKVEDADQSRGNGFGDSRDSGRFNRVCPIVATPPPLLAAVFPWHCEDETRTVKEQQTAGKGGSTADSFTTSSGSLRYGAVQKTARLREEERGCLVPRTEATPFRAQKLLGVPGVGEQLPLFLRVGFIMGYAHAQIFVEVDQYGLDFVNQIDLGSTMGRKKIYGILVKDYYFKQWDPGGNFIF